MSSERTFVCGNKQSVFSARHNSLLARAHSIFRHCLIGGYFKLFYINIKAGQGIGYISSSFVHTTGREKGKLLQGTFLGWHVFKLGVFCDTFREWRIGVESFYAADLRKTEFIFLSCKPSCCIHLLKKLLRLINILLTPTYRAATGEMMSCK